MALAASFTLAIHAAKIHAGFVSAPWLPGIGELLLLVLLGTAWHLSALATGLYDPSRSCRIACELADLGGNALVQLLGMAVALFFLKSPVLNRFFLLLYTASLFASTVAVHWIGRAVSRARRLPPRYRLPVTAAAVLGAAALIFIFLTGQPPRPNIILISIDTLRADRLGCYGFPARTSPSIDAFCRESVQFMQAVSQAPSTASAHMSLFTGLLPPIHRVTNRMVDPETYRRMGLGLAASIPTMAQYLKENGYLTAGFHGGGNVSAILGFDRGFDLYQKTPWEKLFYDRAPLNKVNRWLRQKTVRAKPFFLFVHNYICHDPYLQAPPEFRRRFLTNPVPGLQEELEKTTPEGMKTTRKFNAKRRQWWSLIDGSKESHRRHVRELYDAGVNYADFVLGKFFDSLKRKGLYDRSLIIVTSDHGEQFWEHGGTGHEGWLFIETLHVPLMIKFPGGKYGGRKIDTPVGLFDLMPTLLGHLRISPRLEMQAESLLPLIRGRTFAAPPLVSIHEGLQTLRVSLKNISYSNQPSGDQREWLFDRSLDPGEQHNFAATDTRIVRQMRTLAAKIMNDQRVLRSRIQTGAPDSGKLPEDLEKQLKSLGYL